MDTLCSSHRRVRPGHHEKPVPLDLSHHYSVVTKRRIRSKLKEVYKFFQIPGILNTAGGSCYPTFNVQLVSMTPKTHSTSPTRPPPSRLFPLRYSRSTSSKAREMDTNTEPPRRDCSGVNIIARSRGCHPYRSAQSGGRE